MNEIYKYHHLTERIFAKCGVYFIPKHKKQAKFEIDNLIVKFLPSEEEINNILRTIPGSECWVAMIEDNRIAKAIHQQALKNLGVKNETE